MTSSVRATCDAVRATSAASFRAMKPARSDAGTSAPRSATVQPASLRTWSRQTSPIMWCSPGHAGQDRQRPDPAVDALIRPDPLERAQERLAGEVLLGHGPLSGRPALADELHRLGDEPVVDPRPGPVGEGLPDRPGRQVVVAVGEETRQQLRAVGVRQAELGGGRVDRRERWSVAIVGHGSDSTIGHDEPRYHAGMYLDSLEFLDEERDAVAAVRGARRPDRRTARHARSPAAHGWSGRQLMAPPAVRAGGRPRRRHGAGRQRDRVPPRSAPDGGLGHARRGGRQRRDRRRLGGPLDGRPARRFRRPAGTSCAAISRSCRERAGSSTPIISVSSCHETTTHYEDHIGRPQGRPRRCRPVTLGEILESEAAPARRGVSGQWDRTASSPGRKADDRSRSCRPMAPRPSSRSTSRSRRQRPGRPTPSPSERGAGWVKFAPVELDDHAADRALAWLASAHRRLGPRD